MLGTSETLTSTSGRRRSQVMSSPSPRRCRGDHRRGWGIFAMSMRSANAIRAASSLNLRLARRASQVRARYRIPGSKIAQPLGDAPANGALARPGPSMAMTAGQASSVWPGRSRFWCHALSVRRNTSCVKSDTRCVIRMPNPPMSAVLSGDPRQGPDGSHPSSGGSRGHCTLGAPCGRWSLRRFNPRGGVKLRSPWAGGSWSARAVRCRVLRAQERVRDPGASVGCPARTGALTLRRRVRASSSSSVRRGRRTGAVGRRLSGVGVGQRCRKCGARRRPRRPA